MEVINFNDYSIRTIEHAGETWYSCIDVIASLTESNNPSAYWRKLKQRLSEEGSEVVTICHKLKLTAPDGKMRATDCATRPTILRLIQSIPSPSVEPFKVFLADSGSQTIEEFGNPDLVFARMIESYRQQGCTEDWINARLRSLMARNNLTTTWKERGVTNKEYGILTNDIHKGSFDLTVAEHKEFKNLAKKDNLRDNCSDLELTFITLAETITKELAEKLDAQGFRQNQDVAQESGKQVGESRKRLEKKTGIQVVSKSKWLK